MKAQWRLLAPIRHWVRWHFKKWFILSFLFSIFPSFLSWENRVCKWGTSWKFYLSEVLCITTPLTLGANFLVCWVPKCTVLSCPVNCCESGDVSSRLSNSHHQPWQTDSGSILRRVLRQSRLSGKEWRCLWGQEKGMHRPPLEPHLPWGLLWSTWVFYGVKKYILNTACFHRLKASEFLDLKAVGTIQARRKECIFGDENNELHSWQGWYQVGLSWGLHFTGIQKYIELLRKLGLNVIKHVIYILVVIQALVVGTIVHLYDVALCHKARNHCLTSFLLFWDEGKKRQRGKTGKKKNPNT